jgi:hypothetical protein
MVPGIKINFQKIKSNYEILFKVNQIPVAINSVHFDLFKGVFTAKK